MTRVTIKPICFEVFYLQHPATINVKQHAVACSVENTGKLKKNEKKKENKQQFSREKKVNPTKQNPPFETTKTKQRDTCLYLFLSAVIWLSSLHEPRVLLLAEISCTVARGPESVNSADGLGLKNNEP